LKSCRALKSSSTESPDRASFWISSCAQT